LIGYFFLKLLKADISKNLKFLFPIGSAAGDTMPLCDGCLPRLARVPVLVGAIGGSRSVGAVNRGSLLERIANWI